jgi:hypothetical protein
MTGTVLLATVSAALAGGAAVAVIGLVTLAIRKEERNHTLTGPVPDGVMKAVRRLNGVYVRTPDTTRYSSRHGLGKRTAAARGRKRAQEHTLTEAASDFPRAG